MRPFQRFVLAVILVLWLLPAAEAPAESPNTQILNRAAKLLSDESYWNRADTRECPPNASKLSLYCALRHATEEVMGASSHRTAAMEEVRLVIEEKVGEKYDHRLMGYNNDPAEARRYSCRFEDGGGAARPAAGADRAAHPFSAFFYSRRRPRLRQSYNVRSYG